MHNISIRPIEQKDNATVAAIIRSVLTEYDANKPGTVYYDASTDALFQLFEQPGAFYFVVEADEKIVGGAGIFPTDGLPEGICELVKMYLLPEGRGKGVGKLMIEKCFEQAIHTGYKQMYLETMPELTHAISLYKKTNFETLNQPLGASGHFGCGIWMLKQL